MRDAPRADRPARHTFVAGCSFVVSVLLLGVKFWAYALTGSQAIFSDALESIVNVVAAGFAWFVIGYAGQPADRDHPFGHGKIEFVSAAFEGALIFGAAIVIMWQAVVGILHGVMPQRLDIGVALTGGAGVVNGLVGWWLVRHGRRHHSAAIEADGHHLLSDFWTTVGVLVGLAALRITELAWIDSAVAGVVALQLLATGWRLVRRAGGALLDEEDPVLLRALVAVLAPKVKDGVIRVHHLRAIRSGRFRHISAHVVVPEFWSVQRAHDTAEALAAQLLHEMPGEGDIDFHTDPCERRYCAMCDLEACSVRQQPFARHEPLTVDEAVAPDAEVRGGLLHP